jgi:oligoribonuclease NrnB/cAMP/cGMP phosphodiesterase (DHH superfamily)
VIVGRNDSTNEIAVNTRVGTIVTIFTIVTATDRTETEPKQDALNANRAHIARAGVEPGHRELTKNICFYHAGCPDGFGAVWSVHKVWGESGRYVARGHEDRVRLGECEDAVVAFVDIAPGQDELRELAQVAEQVVVLDHHVTAQDRLMTDSGFVNDLEAEGHLLHFDLSHSGAVLAWNHFSPDQPVPDLLRYVEDQDLWNWALPDSDAVNAAIASYPREFEVWDRLADEPIEVLIEQGKPILRANRVEVERRLDHAKPLALGTDRVEAINACVNRAQLGHELAKRAKYGEEWGLVYRLEGTEIFATIYSIGDLDVSKVALGYGGGGHKNASGFRVSLERWLREFVI